MDDSSYRSDFATLHDYCNSINYDYYYQNMSEIGLNYAPANSCENRRSCHKCPIYVHEVGQANCDDGSNKKCFALVNSATKTAKVCDVPSKPKDKKYKHYYPKFKFNPEERTRSVLDKLEETYWAVWKPTKGKPRVQEHSTIKKGNGDHRMNELFEEFKPNQNHRHQSDCAIFEKRRPKPTRKLTSTQEIQTENFFENEENVLSVPSEISQFEGESKDSLPIVSASEEIIPPSLEPLSELPDESVEAEEEPAILTLKHTDSLVILKKKKSEEQKVEHFPQPKCIRLYKKPGLGATTSYFKTGSYPLKPCLKKESAFKGSFCLGQPGSFVTVTTNSYLKKFKRPY